MKGRRSTLATSSGGRARPAGSARGGRRAARPSPRATTRRPHRPRKNTGPSGPAGRVRVAPRGGGEGVRATRPTRGRECRHDQTREEPRRSVHAPNLSPSLHGTAGADLPVPARASSRPDPAPPGADHAGRTLHRLQPPVARGWPARAVRRQHVGRGPDSPDGPVDRVAAAGVDLLRLSNGVPARKDAVVAGRENAGGAGSGTLP